MYRDCIRNSYTKLAIIFFCILGLGIAVYFIFLKSPTQQITNHAQANPATAIANNLPISTDPYQEGKHYQKLTAKITTHPLVQQFVAADPGKVQVIEFFNYACF